MEKWTRRERAAVEDIYSVRMCHICKHFIREVGMGGIECRMPCATTRKENFEWRGSQGEEAILKMALDCRFCAWRDRAEKADAELRKCYKDIEQLTAERNDLKTMLADAGVRNAVLEKRIDRLLDVIHDDCECESFEVCSNHVSGADCATGYDCKKCWHDWLEQEVQP